MKPNPSAVPVPAPATWQCTGRLAPARERALVREMNLRGCKWDTQLGDTAVLAPFALVIPRTEWAGLARLAEALSSELAALELQLLRGPALWPALGLPRALLQALRRDEPWTPSAARIVRYDFHPTADGWRISEVNSDVPGGFNEASTFTSMMAAEFSGLEPAGDPLAALTATLGAATAGPGVIALLTAPGYNEDLQIVTGIAARLGAAGFQSVICRPEELVWARGSAQIGRGRDTRPVGCIYRFHQGEWLARVPAEKWHPLLKGGLVPVCNPGVAVLSESKRLPLLWDELRVELPTWRRLLPATTSVPRALLGDLGTVVLKPAYGNNGDAVAGLGWQPKREFWLHAFQAVGRSRQWIAQQRFQTTALATPLGPFYPCLGVYTINGRATGIYARLAAGPVIDFSARDVAVLLRD